MNYIEEWKPIIDLDSKYSVSNQGRLKNNYSGRIIKLKRTYYGYMRVDLTFKKKKVVQLIHRTVLKAFSPIKDPENYHVHHINYNPADNRPENLEWSSSSQNLSKKIVKLESYGIFKELLTLYTNEELIFVLNELKNKRGKS